MKFSTTLVLALSLGLGACATQRVHFGDSMSMGSIANYEKSQPFFISGIGQTTDINVREICGAKGAMRIETSETPLDVILSIVTFGIYTPRSVLVYCNK
jgi:hypothetical protein